MTIFNRRNALVGFLTLKWLERRRRKQRNGLKYAALGVLSLGIVAAVGAILIRRQRHEESHLEGYAFGGDVGSDIVDEHGAGASEPSPAT